MRQVLVGIGLIALLIGALATLDLVLRLKVDVLVGTPRIIDGDSLAFGDVNVRLAGIDAPERTQPCRDAAGDKFACGRSATDFLRYLIGDASVTCRGRGRDRYGRMIGQCRVNGVDISETMVRRGWAVAYLGDLEAQEGEARRLEIGLWAGEFDMPAQWRKDRRSASLFTPVGAVREAIATLATVASGGTVLRAPFDE